MATTVRGDWATRLSKSDATVGGKTYKYAKNFNVTTEVDEDDIIYKGQTNTKTALTCSWIPMATSWAGA